MVLENNGVHLSQVQVQWISLSRNTVTYRSRFPNQQISVGFGILVNLKNVNHFYEAIFHNKKNSFRVNSKRLSLTCVCRE